MGAKPENGLERACPHNTPEHVAMKTHCVAQATFSDQDPPLRPWHRRNRRLLQRCRRRHPVGQARLGSIFNTIDTRIDNTTERFRHCGSEFQDGRFIADRRY
jgi:hypothetical protein